MGGAAGKGSKKGNHKIHVGWGRGGAVVGAGGEAHAIDQRPD